MSLTLVDDVAGELLLTLNRLQGMMTRQELLWTHLTVTGGAGETRLFQERVGGVPGDVQTLVTHISCVLARIRDTYYRNYYSHRRPRFTTYATSRQPVQETLDGSRGTVRLAAC